MNLCRFIQKFIQSQRFFPLQWNVGDPFLMRCDANFHVVLWWSHFSSNNNKWKAMKTSFFSDQIGMNVSENFIVNFVEHILLWRILIASSPSPSECVCECIYIFVPRMFIKVDGFRVCRCAVCHGGYTMTAINGGKCVKKHSQINVKHLIENWYNMCMSMSMNFTYKSVRSFASPLSLPSI